MIVLRCCKTSTIAAFLLFLSFLPALYGKVEKDWSAACASQISPPSYPSTALSSGLQGEVIISFDVGKNGQPSSPDIEGHATLADAAWAAVAHTSFPTMCKGARISASFLFCIEGNFWEKSKTRVCYDRPNRISVVSSTREIDCAVWPREAPETGPRGLIPVTVCEILSEPDAFRNRNVALLGRSVTTMEGSWLSEDNCIKQLKTDDHIWENIVWIERSDETAPNPPSNHFAVDPSALARKLERVRKTTGLSLVKDQILEFDKQGKLRTARTRETRQHWEIVFGRIETRANLRGPKGTGTARAWGNGFGHLNAAPVQIVIREKNSTYISDGFQAD